MKYQKWIYGISISAIYMIFYEYKWKLTYFLLTKQTFQQTNTRSKSIIKILNYLGDNCHITLICIILQGYQDIILTAYC